MDTKIREEQGVIVVDVSGRLDAVTAGEFEKTCANVVEDKGACKVVLDFSELEYISSAGLRSLLGLAKKLKASGGGVCLCSLSGIVKDVVSMSGFDQLMPVFDDLQGAIQGNK